MTDEPAGDDSADDGADQRGDADRLGVMLKRMAEQIAADAERAGPADPPRALNRKKRGHCSRLTPARKAAKARSTATKRPKNTICRHAAETDIAQASAAARRDGRSGHIAERGESRILARPNSPHCLRALPRAPRKRSPIGCRAHAGRR